jgi:hypothetical protein
MTRTFLSHLRCVGFLWLLMALCTGSTFGNDLIYRPVNGGLQMSISTNGYQFHVGNGVVSTQQKKAKKRAAAWFPANSMVASVVLANRGSVAVPFTFADEAAAERKFRFRVFSEDGTQVWASEEDAAEEDPEAEGVEQTLVKRSPWRRTVQVPLNVGGEWLPSGRYTLEASVDAAGGPGATAVFEVVNQTIPSIPPAPDTGIKGRVVMSSIWIVTSSTTILPPTKDIPVRAYVTVQEIVPPNVKMIRAPYSWSGFTDDQGNFTAPTIAGRFKVTATLTNLVPTTASRVMPPIDTWPTRPGTIEVEVPLGQYVEALLRIGRGPVIIAKSNVYSVDEVLVASLPTTAPEQRSLRITAHGTVNSGGWSNGQLVPRRSIPWLPMESERLLPVPMDVLEFDFVATPPKGAATTVMSPITATKDVLVPEGVTQIRVYSKTNSQTVTLPVER